MRREGSYEQRLERYNRRMANFRSAYSKEELRRIGEGRSFRPIYQILKMWLQLSYSRYVDISEMMERYADVDNGKNSWIPLLNMVKRMVLHDRKESIREIEELIEETSRGRFHFQHLSALEQLWIYGMDGYDITRVYNEEIGNITYTKLQIIGALIELKKWVKNAEDYRYPAERC